MQSILITEAGEIKIKGAKIVDDYSDARVRLLCAEKSILIRGEKLSITSFYPDTEEIEITGKIESLSFGTLAPDNIITKIFR